MKSAKMLRDITIVTANVLSSLGRNGFSVITTLKILQMIALLVIAHGKSVVLFSFFFFDEGTSRVAGTCDAGVSRSVVENSLEICRHDGQVLQWSCSSANENDINSDSENDDENDKNDDTNDDDKNDDTGQTQKVCLRE